MSNYSWKYELEEYIKQGEPDRVEKSEAWQTAIGLQAVDGLNTSTIGNDVFAENSWYFRNALVRANYNNLQKGIHATTEYLERFFENMLLNKDNALQNRFLHVDYVSNEKEIEIQSANREISKCQNGTLDCALEEMALLRLIIDNPAITQKQLAEKMEKSERTIKRKTVELQEKGYLRRKNGKRNGSWQVEIDLK